MTREFKFRAKSLDGIWFTWRLLDPIDMAHLAIDPKTVGEFTGLLDKNGKEIYEGDIVRCEGFAHEIYTVKYGRASFVLGEEQGRYGVAITMQDGYQMEIIGNIYENPELLTQ